VYRDQSRLHGLRR